LGQFFNYGKENTMKKVQQTRDNGDTETV